MFCLLSKTIIMTFIEEHDIICVYVCLYKCTNEMYVLSTNYIPTCGSINVMVMLWWHRHKTLEVLSGACATIT